MSTNDLSKTFEHLRQTLSLPDEEALTDSELLTRFINQRDQAAFSALFRRHGSMVLTVCRRVLGHVHDAEDALQATFLLLARKAKRVMKRESLGSFLYKVAYRTALEAKTLHDKRKKREKLMVNLPPIEAPAQEIQDWHPLLYRELNRLPEKYREPIVLCDLEGQSRKHVAHQLNVPEGTLSSRLAMARDMLARRLSRRGVELSVGALATVLAQEAAAAPLIPASMVASTTTAATSVAAGKMAAVTIPAVVLMKGVLQAMFLTKLKIAAVSILLVMGVLGAAGFAYRSKYVQAAPPESKKSPSDLEALRNDMELLKLTLRQVLEKVQAQEAELRRLKDRVEGIDKKMSQPRSEDPRIRQEALKQEELKAKREEALKITEIEGELLETQSKIDTARREAAIAKKQLERARTLVQNARAGGTEVEQAELALAKAEGKLQELTFKRQLLQRKLAILREPLKKP